MPLTNPQFIGVVDDRHQTDGPAYFIAKGQPFIYWRTTAAAGTGAWFVRDRDGSSDVTTGITDRNNVNAARQAAAALFTDDGGLIP